MDAVQWQNVADNVTSISTRLVGILQVQSLPLVPVEVSTWLEFTAKNRQQLAADTERLTHRLQFTADTSENEVRIRDEVCRFAASAMEAATAMVDDAKFYDDSCINNAMVVCRVLFDHASYVLAIVKPRTMPPEPPATGMEQKNGDSSGYSPPLDKRGFIELRKRNEILENSDREITRAKKELHAIEEPDTNWRRYRIPLNELRSRQWSYPSEWDPPAS